MRGFEKIILFNGRKKGWIRIMEAVTAILIMASVLIVVYTNNAPEADYSGYVYNLQIGILMDIAGDEFLRNETLKSTEVPDNVSSSLEAFVRQKLPENFDFDLRVCNISSTTCVSENASKINSQVYVEDRIISSNLQKYDPKILRLFVWERSKE